MADRLDLRVHLKFLYSVGAKAPALVDVPNLTVIPLDGVGDPTVSTEYQAALEALMSMAWGVRAHRKAWMPAVDIKVMLLEGVWTLPGSPFSDDPAVPVQLQWSMQVVQPDDLTGDELEMVRTTVMKKKPALGSLADVRLERVQGGPAATMLHVGPFTTEPETIARLHDVIRENGHEPILGHREIYMSDVRRTAPEKVRTILRVAYRQ